MCIRDRGRDVTTKMPNSHALLGPDMHPKRLHSLSLLYDVKVEDKKRKKKKPKLDMHEQQLFIDGPDVSRFTEFDLHMVIVNLLSVIVIIISLADVSSLLAKRLARKSISEMTCFMSRGTSNLNSVSRRYINVCN